MIGKVFGHYRILEKVGRGGMGEVFLAEDTSLRRKVALKFLPPETQKDPMARKRLIREARSAAALDHPYICHINEVVESDGHDFIVMEYVDGRSLKDRLLQGPLTTEDQLTIATEVGEALEAAHAKGIIHRDIKPANIMLTGTGHAKVMDFGLAKQAVPSGETESAEETATALTAEGAAVGTLAYMSPEQLLGRATDARSDIWALGVTLYEMAAGTRPFHGESGFELSLAILNQGPRPLPSDVPAELGAVIEHCLEKDSGNRYQRVTELRAALEAIKEGTSLPWTAWRYRLARQRWIVPAAVLAVIISVLVSLDVGGLRGRLTGRGGGRAVRLAVLPFANLTGDPEQEYLSDGLTQEMIAQLGRLHPQSLGVIARTSVMRYKKTETPIDQIGRELGVEYVLEGSAQREGSRVRVSAELIEVRDQSQLWSDVYEQEMAGWLVLQSNVARRVAESLALKLLPAEQARLASARQVNPEAYDLYLKASQYWIKLTREDVDTAEDYMNLALQKQPDFARSWVGLFWVWSCRNQFGYAPPSEAVPHMKEAALKAIALDDTLSEAHFALANLRTWAELNPPAAEQEWKRAVELDPNYPEGLMSYSHFLAIMGRVDEAIREIDRALSLDPFNVMIHSFRSMDFVMARRYDEAIDEARKALAMQPGHPLALSGLFNALVEKGMDQEAISTMKEYLKIYHLPDPDGIMDKGFSQGGFKGAMRRAADSLGGQVAKGGEGSPTDISWLYLCAGDKSRALDWLEKGYEMRDPNMPYIGVIPIYDPLRSDPRFQSLLRRMNLPL